ncbi:carboxymuconolactone decarboxylase family protein [uncultured Ferrovibrio sp.]|jgi:AhpD family alkylhydroperoxidase|uniref:carboxymuconolactone decarboxylase family protein n=1 Tax=uncultured Ferrovibrio sp. TaxID=1576913 RepID=UPI0026095429|nr:carboxymuconolactone decarboxylase family protein [uncultured Ferrovibrio sp.]
MTQRLDYRALSPEGIKGLFAGHAHMAATVPRPLLDILWVRISQINGCAYCVDQHSREAKEHGASDRKLHHVAIWWESPLFDEKERAALAYAEAVTRLEHQRVPDAVFEPLKGLFDDRMIVELTIAIATMNAWNRLAIAMKKGAPA